MESATDSETGGSSATEELQQAGVVQPSSSPWSSPVVMVRKKDGTHRSCVDYRHLNAVTSLTHPLPRMDDLLDQLGQCYYFSTLNLASGYWQIRVHQDSREKAAFVMPQGLRVMRFGLSNAPPYSNGSCRRCYGPQPRSWTTLCGCIHRRYDSVLSDAERTLPAPPFKSSHGSKKKALS